MSALPKKLLIIANSARMLAQATRNAKLLPFVIDCYGDQDTQKLSEYYQQVTSLSIVDLSPVIAQFKQHGISHLIYGSGFESHPNSLKFLAQHFEILGNSPEIFLALQNKHDFFQNLQNLHITFPQISFTAPKNNANWLIKPQHSQGGLNIAHLSNVSTQNLTQNNDIYYQRYLAGKALSVLFLANGTQARVIGFNQQWTVELNQQPFVFAGIVNHAELSLTQQQTLTNWVEKLTAAYSLRGLNSLDFMLVENTCYVLEINPRPPASMQLYEEDLLSAHLLSINGGSIKKNKNQTKTKFYKAYQILYAPQKIQITAQTQWLKDCVDIPAPGAIISKDQPLCSIIASGKNLNHVLSALRLKTHTFFQQLSNQNTMQYQASVNKLTQPLVQELLDNADKLRLNVQTMENGCTVIDAGIKAPGGLEAGRIITEICLGGMGTVSISQSAYTEKWPLTVNVHTSNPVLACLGSQYAGWSLSHEKYYALGSGPARAMAKKTKDGVTHPVEELYKELDYQDSHDKTVLVIENDKLPPVEIVEKVAAACGVSPENLTIIVTPTSSLAGCVQVVGRVLEVAMHKAHELHFPLENILDGSGSAPICPPHPDFVQAMGRTNDAILFAGQVHIFVKGSDEAAEKLAKELPSSTSKDYGKPFAQIFKECKYDFFKIDGMLFSPASVIVTAVESGNSFRAGKLDNELLNLSFGG
jgi:methenyltetrahydromethanopterin cyclohydrolase